MKHLTHWIGGKPWDGEAERHGDVYDPATGQVSGRVDFAARAEVDAAVAAAKDALIHWRRVSLARRARSCSRSATRQGQRGEPGPADHRRARQGGLTTPPARWPAVSRSSNSPAASRTC